ncbi:MAG TPA: TonB-dependent receptor [Woeseiaceae bacterium]|nr:TonB-dependent receptor [Woeseiaceae bacterium]
MNHQARLSLFAASGLALLWSAASMAQDNETELEEIVVTGVKFSLTQAVEAKRAAIPIVDALVAEDIGKFPDNNVVEAMQRIPGVQVTDRGSGEVSAVSIRGLSDVTTTINGRNIFTASGRAVALQDIPSALINRVDVYKSRSPEHIARGIAGQIDVHTPRPLDFDEGLVLRAQSRFIHQEQADKTDPQFAVLFSNRWRVGGGDFGALFNVSYTRTNYRDQAANAGASFPFRLPDDPEGPLAQIPTEVGWTPGLERGLPIAPGSTLDLNPDVEFLHWRDAMFNFDFRGERERPAANLALQWAPNDASTYTFEVFYNGYRADIFNSLWFQFLNSPVYDITDPIEIYEGTNVIRSRTMGDGFSFTSGDVLDQSTDSYLYAVKGEWQLTDNLHVVSDLYYQDSEFENDFWGQRIARIAPEFFIDINSGDGVPYIDYDPNNTGSPATDPTNRDNYFLDWAFPNGDRDEGDALTWTADADLDVEFGWVNTLSFGLRWDKRSAKERHFEFAGGPADGTTLADLPPEFVTVSRDEFFNGHPGVVGSWAVANGDWVRANRERLVGIYGFPIPDVYPLVFEIDETQVAFYAQADFATDLANGGFIDGRVGFRWLDAETDITVPDASSTNKNDTLLPSLMVRWGINDDLLARFSYTETFNLPTFLDLNPNIQYFPDVTDIGYGTASGGNPDLEPEESKNLDVSLEWYFAEGSVLYGTWFRRDISNQIIGFRNAVVVDVPDDIPDRGPYTYILSQPDNAGEATLDGWEFGFTWFPRLSGLAEGLGIQASYTLLDSEEEIPVLDEQGNIVRVDILPIGGVSESSYSVILAYDRERFNARLSWFWRDDFYNNNEAALFANPLRIWRSAEESLDFQFTWNASENWTVTFDATNLTEPEFHWNYGNMPHLFNFHNYLYSRTFALGARYSFGR